MSKMSKDFKTKSCLRMADGGIAGLAGKRERVIEEQTNPALRPAVAVQTAPAEPTEQEKAKAVGISIPAPQPAAPPTPKPGVFSRLRKAIGFAQGGAVWDSAYQNGTFSTRATMTPKPASPLATPAVTPTPAVSQPTAAGAPTALAPASPVATPAAPSNSIATANVSFKPDLGAVGDGLTQFGRMATSSSGYPTGLRSGGQVTGPGGPRDDKIPALLSNGEYVLPAKTVDALGGPAALDPMVKATNDGREPKHGLRKAADGGIFYADEFGNISNGPKQVPATIPQQQFKPPVRVYPSIGPEKDITPPQTGERVVQGKAEVQPPKRGLRMPDLGKRINSPAGKLGMLGAAGAAAYDAFNTPTEQYAKRFGFEGVPNNVPGTVGLRALGAASDLGNALTFGLAGNLYRDKQDAAPATPTPVTPVTSAVSTEPIGPPSGLRGPVPVAPMNPQGAPDTGGQIMRQGNTFYGGVDAAQAKELQAIETQRAQQRYANDAAGMYAAIQGHIANGDLETAAKLAWDPQSRALVSQGYAARNAAAAAPNYGVDEAGINARAKSREDGLRRIFSSDKAKGNLAKHLTASENTRVAELSRAGDQATTRRGQDIAAANNAARIANDNANERAKLAASTAAERAKLAQDQMNKDRDFQLNKAKYGTEVAKMLFDQGEKIKSDNQKQIDEFTSKQFIGPDGKPDLASAARFNEFIKGSMGDIHKLDKPERDRVLAEALTKFRINEKANANKGLIGGKTSSSFRETGVPRASNISDIVHGLPVSDYIGSKMPWGMTDVVDIPGVGVRSVSKLGASEDADVQDYVYRRGLRRD